MREVQDQRGSKPGSFRPDRGWAWMVLLGAVIEMIIVMGVMKAGGILLLAYQKRFEASATVASLVSTIQYAVYSFVTPVVMTAGLKLTTCRNLVFAGSLLMSLSYIITAWMDDIRWVMVSSGAIQGLGWACVGPTTLAIIGQYFEKRRGLANSIAVSSASAGGLMFAPVITELLEWYGFSGCMLLLAGIHLNLCICAALFRPMEQYSRGHKMETEKLMKENPEHAGGDQYSDVAIKSNTRNKSRSSYESDVDIGKDSVADSNGLGDSNKAHELEEQLDNSRKGFTVVLVGVKSENKEQDCINTCEIQDTHSNDTSTKLLEARTCENNVSSKKDNNSKIGTALKAFVNFFDFRLFKSPVFILLQIAFAFVATGSRLTTIYMVTHAKDLDINKHKIATLITIYSSIDLVGRILVGILADLKIVQGSVIIGIYASVVGVTSLLIQFYTSYWLLAVYSVVLGLVSGAPPALLGPVIVDYMTVRNLPSTLGFTTMTLGLVNALSYYVAGFLRDTYLSYVPSFYFIGGISLIGGGIMLALPLIENKTKSSPNIKEDSK